MGNALHSPKVAVIGAGIGGLVSALLLAHKGLDVTLFEASDTPGGKIRQVHVDGVGIDSGPTVFTMRWIFDQMLAELGSSLESLLELEPLGILARHAWVGTDGYLDLHSDKTLSFESIAQFTNKQEAVRFLEFCKQTQTLYNTLEKPYIRSEKPDVISMVKDLGLGGLSALGGLGPFSSLWQSLGKHFHDPRLQQLFGRYATYCGSSPWLAPATLMLIAQVEMDGVWSVRGGMFEVARALAAMGQTYGVTLRYGSTCERIMLKNGQVTGVCLKGGEVFASDYVVFNGDVNALSQGLLGEELRPSFQIPALRERSLSAYTLSMHAQSSGFPLVRHNVFFDNDYKSEFTDIFQNRRLPQSGTVYLCAQDRDDSGLQQTPHERILCLINAPSDDGFNTLAQPEIEKCELSRLQHLRQCGLEIQAKPHQIIRTLPQDFARLFPGSQGALYGQATHGWTSAFHRPSAKTMIPGLYLTGGSVHPGPGVPMAAMSGRIAAARLMADRDSTSRSSRVVISGGISMH
ncbi:MAG: phytoene desaturase [Burkholderiales bacterium]|nr:phytoene desaturase [Burkholderiales bacterium]